MSIEEKMEPNYQDILWRSKIIKRRYVLRLFITSEHEETRYLIDIRRHSSRFDKRGLTVYPGCSTRKKRRKKCNKAHSLESLHTTFTENTCLETNIPSDYKVFASKLHRVGVEVCQLPSENNPRIVSAPRHPVFNCLSFFKPF